MVKLLTDGEYATLAAAIAVNPARNGSDAFRQPIKQKHVLTPCIGPATLRDWHIPYVEYRIKKFERPSTDGFEYFYRWVRV